MRHFSTTYILVWSALMVCLTAWAPDAEQLEQQLDEAETILAAGNTAEADKLFLKLSEQYAKQKNWERVSLCYYNIATLYLNQRDTIGMQQTLYKMSELQQYAPENSALQYDYLSVRQQ